MADEFHRASSRRVIWYALAALALVAIVALNRELLFMSNYAEQQNGAEDSTADEPEMSHSKPKPIKQISILGERNSGTRWTYR